MKWKWIILSLITLVVVAFVLSPTVMWDGRKEFTLALSAPSAAQTAELFYRDQGNLEMGQHLCGLFRTENFPNIEEMFQPVTLSPEGRFTVKVPTFGTTRFWGLWQKRGMYEYVILMGKTKTGLRVFKCVSVKSGQPVNLE